MQSPNLPRWFLLVLILALLLAPLSSAGAAPRQPVNLQFLSISDWHGQLDPLNVFGIGNVGGAAALSTYFQMERTANPNTLTLTAGDAYGATPPLSNFFEEVPAVLAMRLMGFDADTLGNHNFDRGIDHLQQMIDLAGEPAGVEPGEPFQYVSANLQNRDDNLSGVKDFEIFEVGGVKVAVIGFTNPEAPTLVFPGSFGTIEVTDPVPAANKAMAQARRAGAKVFVALIHAGVTGFDPDTGEAFGPLIDFAENVGGFHLILGDHTDFEYTGIHNNALVVENRSKGRTYARINLEVDPHNGRAVSRSVEFITPVTDAVPPDPAIVEMLQPFRDELAPIFNTVVGESNVFIPRADACGRADGRLCESLIGNVTTDSMRLRYGTDFAITNSGGIRADLTCPLVDIASDFCPPYTPPPFPITRGQVLTVLPFGNVVVTVDVSGEELKTFLENGVSAMPGANGRFPQVSGLCFTYDISAPAGDRVTGAVRQEADGSCTGDPVDLSAAATYSIATNDFMASGGDGYPVVIGQAVTREIMDQVLAEYVMDNSPLSPAIQGRIECTTSGATACPVILP
jgi:2',3'-cyclic-nucleotide 2'-phosphodiesterase (5'-nucleotidase family)